MAAGAKPEPRWGDDPGTASPSRPRRCWSRRGWWIVAAVVAAAAVLIVWAPWHSSHRKRQPSARAVDEVASTPSAAAPDGSAARDSRATLPATPEAYVAEAKQLAGRLLQDFPKDLHAKVLAGRIYYAFNDAARANECWTDCLKRSPDFAEVRCAVAEGAWEHGDFERAAAELSAVFAANPRLDPKQVFFLADALMNLGRAEEAVAALERLAQENPLPPFGLFLLGNAYMESGRFEKARDQFAAVLAADPQSINAHYGLATAYARLGQAEKSQQHKAEYAKLRSHELRESERLRPQMRKADWGDPKPVVRECYLNAAKLCITSGRATETEQHLLRALAIDPESEETRNLLELLYRKQGRHEEAMRISPRGSKP